jgi:quercetin dioxygenase-like cupin family protein
MRKIFATLALSVTVFLAVGTGTAGATPGSGVSAQVIADFAFGPTRILVQVLTIQPAGTTGWHSHPGLTTVIVLSGTGTFYAPDCVPRRFWPVGSFTELPGEVGVLRNEGASPLVILVVFRLPAGMPPRIDEPAPAGCAVR